MNHSLILEELVGVLEARGITVRREPLEDSSGGLCRIGGKQVLFLDAAADPLSLASRCARTLRDTTDIDSIYLRPDVREFVESVRP